MAKIVFNGAIVQDMSGSMGASVVSKWKGRNYIRLASPSINNPRTEAQARVRNRLSELLELWKSLTEGQKALWEEYAQAQGRQSQADAQVGSKGIIPTPGILMSGVNAFVGVNQRLASAGLPYVTVPPEGSVAGAQALIVTYGGGDLDIEARFPAGSLLSDDIVRFWGLGAWKAGHAYILGTGTPIDITADPIVAQLSIDTWRVGGGMNVSEVPLTELEGRVVKIQVDVVRPTGAFSPGSTVKTCILSA